MKYCVRRSGNTSEFAVVLFIFFMMFLFPLIDLVALATGAATVALAAREAASSAGVSAAYDMAIKAVVVQSQKVVSSGLGNFAKLTPVGGVNGSGAHLYIVKTDYATSQVQFCGPDQLAPSPVDTTGFIYEYMAMVRYDVGPFLNLSFVPFIGSIPGLGQPAQLTFTGHSAVEHTVGICSSNSPQWNEGPGSVWTSSLDLPSPW